MFIIYFLWFWVLLLALCSQSGTTSVFYERHRLVVSCYYMLYLFLVWLIFVSGCAFFCSLILNGATSFWEEGLEFVLSQICG